MSIWGKWAPELMGTGANGKWSLEENEYFGQMRILGKYIFGGIGRRGNGH